MKIFACSSEDIPWPFQNCRLLADPENKYVFCDHQYMYMALAFKYKMEKNFIFTGIHVNEYLFQRMEQSKYYFYAIGGIISCVRNVYNLETTWLAMRITILEGHNSSFGFILYVDMENRHYEAHHYLILVVQYTGSPCGTPQFYEKAVWGPLI